MRSVHATAIVEPGAELAADVVIGPYAVVERDVVLSSGCVLHAHAVVRGPTTLGEKTEIYPFAVIGGQPQAKWHRGGSGRLEVGAGNIFREHVTVHGGTEGRATRIAADNLFMVGAHVGHDARIGSHCVVSNAVQLAGHAVVEDWATLGGQSGVAQHVTVGESAFVAASSACERDVPSFVVVQGDRARVRGLNEVGLRRRGISEPTIARLRRAVRTLWMSTLTRSEALRALESDPDACVRKLIADLRRSA